MQTGVPTPLLDGVVPDSLPALANAGAVVALVAGLVLWIAGGKVLRPLLALLGFVAGAAGGALVATRLFPADAAGIPSGYAGVAVGSLVGALLALALFRFAMAAGAGVVFAAAGVLAAGVYLSFTPGGLPLDAAGAREAASRLIGPAATASLSRASTATAAPDDAAPNTLADAARAETAGLWARLPESSRAILVGAGLLGALAGLGLGALAPARAAAVVTAWLGSVLWLASLAWLASTLHIPGRQFLDQGPLAWMAIWLVVALIGLAVQTSGRSPSPRTA